jgi:hypothetical protein
MSTAISILSAVLLGFLVYGMYRTFRTNPALLDRANLSKSFGTMGFLALGLIAFVAFIVLLLR